MQPNSRQIMKEEWTEFAGGSEVVSWGELRCLGGREVY